MRLLIDDRKVLRANCKTIYQQVCINYPLPLCRRSLLKYRSMIYGGRQLVVNIINKKNTVSRNRITLSENLNFIFETSLTREKLIIKFLHSIETRTVSYYGKKVDFNRILTLQKILLNSFNTTSCSSLHLINSADDSICKTDTYN